ncbi:hypothetical protein BBJ28_00008603 [Nothophytophthora sp. Chile5]|nr:hypothetical protein BBJ28_00008603 [Nothophytophthora sp. Chile5]
MDDDVGTIPVDFLRELDFWLLEGGAASPALPRPDAVPTSQRQKEELAYLRSKTQQLETTLTTLKQQNREELERQQQEKVQNGEVDAGGMASTDLVVKSASGAAFSGQREVSLWERIAKRQREEKAKAEVENAKLREMVQSQIRLVKSFERLLRKRRVWDQLQDDKWHRSVTKGRKEEEIFDEMLRAVDARYPHSEAILEEHGLGDSDPAVNVGDDANMKYSAADGMYLEFKEKKFMPFDYSSLDDVVWRSYGEGKLKLEDSTMTIVKQTEDVIFSKSILPPPRRAAGSSESKESGNLVLLSVMKRFPEERRVAYVWFSTMSVDRTKEGDGPPVHLIQKGCSVMAPATLMDGSPGCVSKSYSSSVPTLLGEIPEDPELQQAQHREVGMLTEMIFASYQQSRQNINQTLENLLLDEMMAKNTSSTTETESSTEAGSSERLTE